MRIFNLIKYVGIISMFLMEMTSCTSLNTSAMFQVPKKSEYVYDTILTLPIEEHRISFGDRFSFSFSTNKGERIVLGSSGVSNLTNSTTSSTTTYNQDYLVLNDGTAELPLVGIINVAGKSISELENELEKFLSNDFLQPFVQIKLTNQRVTIFPGKNSGQVITLQNTNTTLIELIAMANGIREDACANSIKLIRKIKNKTAIYKIDLSTLGGVKQGQMLVQSNDCIYIDSNPRIFREVFKEITPWLSIFSSSLAIFAIFKK